MSPILGIYASQISGHLWAPSGAYDALASVTVPSGGVSSISFNGIPTNGYKHLQIRGIARGSYTGSNPAMTARFNSDSSSSYALHELYGYGTGTSGGVSTSDNWISVARLAYDGLASGIFTGFTMDILDYANTSKYKTTRTLSGYDANGVEGQIVFYSGLWMNTSAISSITLQPNTQNFTQYSSFALYGVK